MLERERQVLLTYITWRWIWLIIPASVALIGGAYWVALYHSDKAVSLMVMIYGLGFPCMMAFAWLVAVAKWQFANPRARLVPGYPWSHLGVLAAIILALLVLHPLCLAAVSGLGPLGPLAFALMLGGTMLWATHINSGLAAPPVLLIFLSGTTEVGQRFWSTQQAGNSLLSLLAACGAFLVVGWLWRLVHLDEEMDDCQVAPIGQIAMSRLELAEQRRIQGKQAARSGLIAALIDRWHDRPHSENHAELMQYGFGRVSGQLQAVFVGISCAVYGVVLYKLHFINADIEGPESLLFPIAIVVVVLLSLGAALIRTARRTWLRAELG